MGKEKDKDKDEYSPVGFGHGRSGADVFDEQHDFDRWEDNNKVNWSRPGESSYAEEQWDKQNYRNFAANRARSAATGAWVTRANEHAKALYEEDGLSYNDMRKYAAGAGVSDINSENDVTAIRDHINATYTSQSELDEALAGMKPEATEEETDPTKQQQPIAYSDAVARARARSGNPNTTSITKSVTKSNTAPPQDGADTAAEETGSFLDRFKLDLKGTHKPATKKNIEVAKDVVNATNDI